MRSSSREPSSNSWLPTPATSRPSAFIASIVGSSWNSALTSGLAPIRSPAETTKLRPAAAASSRRTCVARLTVPPASVEPIRPLEPSGVSRLPCTSLTASTCTSTVPVPCACAAGAAASSAATTVSARRPTRIRLLPVLGV
jgi:hypothetical protein